MKKRIIIIVFLILLSVAIAELYPFVLLNFWRIAINLVVGYGFEKGADIVFEWLSNSRNEIKKQRYQAVNLPYDRTSEKIEIIRYCDQVDQALTRLEEYIRQNRYEQEKIKSFLKRLYEDELKPLAERMDKVENRLQDLYSWRQYVETRQREWDIWRTNVENRLGRLENVTEQTQKDLGDTQAKLSDLEYRLLPKLVFNVNYQWLEIFDKFWDKQFGSTPIAEHNRVDYEGYGGDIGILLSGFVRLGCGAHLMNERKLTRETTNTFTGQKEKFALSISGKGYQTFGIVSLDVSRKIGIEGGAGYYWLDYRVNDLTNGIATTRIWKNEGAYAIGGLTLIFKDLKIYGEGNIAIKSKKAFAFVYKRVGLRWSIPIRQYN